MSQQGASDPEAKLDAGWHLLHGGEEVRGAEMLADAGVELAIDADGLPAAIPALRAVVAACLLVAVRTAFDPRFRTVISAPDTTAPAESVTVP